MRRTDQIRDGLGSSRQVETCPIIDIRRIAYDDHIQIDENLVLPRFRQRLRGTRPTEVIGRLSSASGIPCDGYDRLTGPGPR
jgi:hypothetical protein